MVRFPTTRGIRRLFSADPRSSWEPSARFEGGLPITPIVPIVPATVAPAIAPVAPAAIAPIVPHSRAPSAVAPIAPPERGETVFGGPLVEGEAGLLVGKFFLNILDTGFQRIELGLVLAESICGLGFFAGREHRSAGECKQRGK